MTILPSRMTTAGLNVPADSHPSPRGPITGVSDIRRQAPKGRLPLSWTLSASNRTTNWSKALLWIEAFILRRSFCSDHCEARNLSFQDRMRQVVRKSENGRADLLQLR